jgi:hypothetical protein
MVHPQSTLEAVAAAVMVELERIKMPKRGVNWVFLKINCKN